jgi:5,10-methylenetetrahydromethanopterin reductase
MRGCLKVLRALLDGEPVTFQGATLRSNWKKSHLPIYLAADGPKMLAVAGELADGVILGAGITPEVLAWARTAIAEGEVQAGREPGSTPMWLDTIVSVGEDRAAVRQALRSRLCIRANHNFRMGFHGVPDEHLPGVRRFRERYDETDVGAKTRNAELITDYIIDRFAIAATDDDLVTRFAELQAQGVENVIVAMPFRLEERYAIIETLAREVMPRVRALAGPGNQEPEGRSWQATS